MQVRFLPGTNAKKQNSHLFITSFMTTVVIPTYNEAENIAGICLQIFVYLPNAKILIIDDSSIDGTQEIIKRLHSENENIEYIFRTGAKNFAQSYIDGFKKAITSGTNYIIQMDADGSHNPKYLPTIEKELENNDVVVGSRYIKEGGTQNWSWKRQLLSRAGNLFAAISTHLWIHDLTSGFVGWKKNTLQNILFSQISVNGYAFQIELKHLAYKNKAKIKEIPITFIDRTKGVSKMNKLIALEAIKMCFYKIIKK